MTTTQVAYTLGLIAGSLMGLVYLARKIENRKKVEGYPSVEAAVEE